MRAASSRMLASLTRDEFLRLTAIAAITLAAVAASLAIEGGAAGMLAAGLAVVAMVIAVIDARRFIIPDELNFAAALLGLAYAALLAPSAIEGLALALLRGAVTALAFLAIRSAYRRLRGRDGLGLGDVKLAVVAGIWLDWTMIPIAIDIAAGAGLVAYGLRQVAGGRAIRSSGRLPFGLFFAPAIWIGWMLERWLLAAGLA